MVSSAVNMSLQELLATLERFRSQYAHDLDYLRARSELPADWPL